MEISEAKAPAKAQKALGEICQNEAKPYLAMPATSTFAPPVLRVEFPSLETSLKIFEKKSKRSRKEEEDDENDEGSQSREGQNARQFLDGPSLARFKVSPRVKLCVSVEGNSKIIQGQGKEIQKMATLNSIGGVHKMHATFWITRVWPVKGTR